MSRIIYRNEALRKRIEARKPEDKNVYINFDAIANLPDEYEAIISEVLFDPLKLADFFSDVSGKGEVWMPSTALMYEIAEACGISGIGQPISEPIYNEIDINPMLRAPMDALPQIRKQIVGRRVSKQSQVMQEDGTMRTSSICTSEYNAFDRCLEVWSKEEMYTDGYSKPGKFPPKYDNKFKRKHHFDEEMKFAQPKAETKAHIKTIRELAKLQTGFKTEDLREGVLIFVKIIRSSMAIKMETAARLESIRNGNRPELQAGKELFGIEDKTEPPKADETFAEFSVEPQPVELSPLDLEPRDRLIYVLQYYSERDMIPKTDEFQKSTTQLLSWLTKTQDAFSAKDKYKSKSGLTYWDAAINTLKRLEDPANIPAEGRIDHKLY